MKVAGVDSRVVVVGCLSSDTIESGSRALRLMLWRFESLLIFLGSYFDDGSAL